MASHPQNHTLNAPFPRPVKHPSTSTLHLDNAKGSNSPSSISIQGGYLAAEGLGGRWRLARYGEPRCSPEYVDTDDYEKEE